MTNANTSASGPDPLFHPAAHYPSPNAVLADRDLSTAEKRIILSSWASDMFAVESHPALREIPGMDHPIRLADILAAMRKLDDDDDPPPRGGVPMRLRHAASETECDDEDRPSGPRNAIDRGAQRRIARPVVIRSERTATSWRRGKGRHRRWDRTDAETARAVSLNFRSRRPDGGGGGLPAGSPPPGRAAMRGS
ncbi:hypothetical protein [Bradyrhizobium liaoningense]|uniref:hypothetical protein n=1 Tax=Bradyrhizobium liaoningense TaxID=43992 RepID=UPI0020116959|nr:hypothetical protein [Bradyrhizobium liaoningense]